MLINRRIKLGDRNFYISCECEYNKKDGYIALELKNYKDKYYDDGDLSILIEKIENNYDDSTYKKYDTEKWLVSDCLYIYDNIPFESTTEFQCKNNDFISGVSIKGTIIK